MTFAFVAGSAALLLAPAAFAEGFGSHGMSGRHSMGSFSGARSRPSFSSLRPSFGMPPMPPPPGMMPPPPGTKAPGSTTGTSPGGTVTTGTGMTGSGMTGSDMHHRHFDDDDDFFFAVFPFPDPFFVDVVQPIYVSPNNEYWYWCPSSHAYFPWVRTCAVPWEPVPASPGY